MLILTDGFRTENQDTFTIGGTHIAMSLSRRFLLASTFVSMLGVGLFLTASSAAAHAILLESTPATKSIVSGPGMVVRLRFNVRIDASRSRLTLIRKDGSTQKLDIDKKQPSPDTLTAPADRMQPDEYRIRWQVLAPDGHISNGEIPFSVRPT